LSPPAQPDDGGFDHAQLPIVLIATFGAIPSPISFTVTGATP
jgi:hypothetical protein